MTIDLRTDALTAPTDAMWDAMRSATFGWSDDESRHVRELEALAAELLGKPAAVLMSTCSMANLVALLALTERGTQAVFEQNAHMVVLEEWGFSYLGGIFPRLIAGSDGQINPEELRQVITDAKAMDLPRTSLLCLENSHNNAGGTVTSVAELEALASIAHRHGAAVHIDGARLLNAAAALGVNARELTACSDTVSLSLNKGLSAPWGAVLAGNNPIIERSRRLMRRIGAASVHKEGMLAAAGVVGLKEMVPVLAEDNRRAAMLAKGISQIQGLHVDLRTVVTNIVLVDTTPSGVPASELVARLERADILTKGRSGEFQIRLVTHRHITDDHVPVVIRAMRECLEEGSIIAQQRLPAAT